MYFFIHYKYTDINVTLISVASLVGIMYYRIYSQKFVEFTGVLINVYFVSCMKRVSSYSHLLPCMCLGTSSNVLRIVI